MASAFGVALSALSATASAIDVVGNNLANLNTTGYKSSQVQFKDLMSQSLGGSTNPAQLGLGVGTIQTVTNYTQGTVSTTNVGTNVAIQGSGFFIVKDSNNQTLYTRDGSFQVDASGNLITSSGDYVQGYPAVGGVVNPSAAIGNLKVPVGSVVPATATANMNLTVNLDASTAINGSYSAPIQVIDSLGMNHTLTIAFTKTGVNTWNYEVDIPNADLAAAGTAGVTPNSSQLTTGTLSFTSNGTLDLTASPTPVKVSITGLADGATDLTGGDGLGMNWNLTDTLGNATITQFGEASSVGGTTQDGIQTGQVASVTIQNGGLIVAQYSNGQAVNVGQLALAGISNPQTLVSVGDNNLQATATTALPAIGIANTGGRGKLIGESLEGSTSDMATEFTHLLSYERSYQAASRVITTTDQMLQETVNLIRA
jgi:flagellar hook protein FlgE